MTRIEGEGKIHPASGGSKIRRDKAKGPPEKRAPKGKPKNETGKSKRERYRPPGMGQHIDEDA
jgi:hypothetical protein